MCIFFSFSTDSANLTVRAGAVLRGLLGVTRDVSFYVTYPYYDDDVMDYDVALVKVHSVKLQVRLLSFYQCSTFISLAECAHSRQQKQWTQSHCIETNKEGSKQDATIAAPPCLHLHLYELRDTFHTRVTF
jgi:hypothetical protein